MCATGRGESNKPLPGILCDVLSIYSLSHLAYILSLQQEIEPKKQFVRCSEYIQTIWGTGLGRVPSTCGAPISEVQVRRGWILPLLLLDPLARGGSDGVSPVCFDTSQYSILTQYLMPLRSVPGLFCRHGICSLVAWLCFCCCGHCAR